MEGQSFEKYEVSKSETGHDVDVESVLEKGEIVSVETFEGYFPIKRVTIKDDGRGIFRPTDIKRNTQNKKLELRTELELLAVSLDKILGFGLVPTAVSREVNGEQGTLQKYLEKAKPAAVFWNRWSQLISDLELQKAAVFDFLIEAGDRNLGNFLIDPERKKVWLIDHDKLMLLGKFYKSFLLTETVAKKLGKIPSDLLESVAKLLQKIDELDLNADLEISGIRARIKERARTLLRDKEITRLTI